MVQKLREGLSGFRYYQPQIIAVSINSEGGSITQAKNINSIVQKFSRETSAPVFTFAEDFSLGPANIILTAGNKCFASQHSIIGEHSFFYRSFGYKKLLEKYDIQAEYISQGKNKVKINPFEDLTEEGSKWVDGVLDEMEYELKSQVIKNRQEAFQNKKLTNEALEKEVFQTPILTAEEALNYGFIDGISTLEKTVTERYGLMKHVEVMKRGLFDDRVKSMPEKWYADI